MLEAKASARMKRSAMGHLQRGLHRRLVGQLRALVDNWRFTVIEAFHQQEVQLLSENNVHFDQYREEVLRLTQRVTELDAFECSMEGAIPSRRWVNGGGLL